MSRCASFRFFGLAITLFEVNASRVNVYLRINYGFALTFKGRTAFLFLCAAARAAAYVFTPKEQCARHAPRASATPSIRARSARLRAVCQSSLCCVDAWCCSVGWFSLGSGVLGTPAGLCAVVDALFHLYIHQRYIALPNL